MNKYKIRNIIIVILVVLMGLKIGSYYWNDHQQTIKLEQETLESQEHQKEQNEYLIIMFPSEFFFALPVIEQETGNDRINRNTLLRNGKSNEELDPDMEGYFEAYGMTYIYAEDGVNRIHAMDLFLKVPTGKTLLSSKLNSNGELDDITGEYYGLQEQLKSIVGGDTFDSQVLQDHGEEICELLHRYYSKSPNGMDVFEEMLFPRNEGYKYEYGRIFTYKNDPPISSEEASVS